MQQQSEVKPSIIKISAIKTWIVALAIILPPIFYILNLVIMSWGMGWIYPAILPLPMLWNLLILYLFSRISKSFKLSQQDLTLLFMILWLSAGSMYASYGMYYWPPSELLVGGSMDYAIRGLAAGDPYSSVWQANLAPILAPKDSAVVKAFWYGGAFDFAAWLGPIIFWILWALAIYLGMTFMGYTLRKPLVEIERLPFPGVASTIYLLKYYTTETDGKPLMFNFKLNISKLFWIGVIVGIIFSIPGQIANLMPMYSGANALVAYPVDLSILSGVLPGAVLGGTIYITDIMVGQFVPMDALATAVLYWFVFGVLFQTTSVRVGWMPIGGPPPFLWDTFAWLGIVPGLGVYVIWKYRDHLYNIFAKGLKGEREEDDGVSYSLIAWGSIGTYLLQVVLFAIIGTPIIMAILIPLLYTVFMYGWTRQACEIDEFLPDTSTYAPIIFSTGTFLGQWGPPPSPSSAAFNTILLYHAYGCGVDGDAGRMSAFQMPHFFKSYKLAYETNTKSSDVMVIGLITMISTIIFAYFTWPWFMTRFGGSSTIYQLEHADLDDNILPWTYGTPPSRPTIPEAWTYFIVGIITVFIIYYLRAKFVWFFINPIGTAMLPGGWWPTWLIALVIKYVVLKIGGSKFFEEKWIPFVVGFIAGFAALYIFGAAIVFFGTALPAWISRW